MNTIIAIITDDVLFFNLLSRLLLKKNTDLEIRSCSNFNEIDSKLGNTNSNLIIVDGGISNISPIETIQYLRMSKQILAPVWFFPEIKTSEYIHESLLTGASKIIDKPFDPYLVVDEIVTLLSK